MAVKALIMEYIYIGGKQAINSFPIGLKVLFTVANSYLGL